MAKTSLNRRAVVGGGLAALAGAGALGWWRFAGPGAFDPEARTCNICGTTARFRGFARRQNAVCPNCKAKERHRLLMHYLEHETDVWSAELDVLHFSPDAAQKAVFRERSNLNYVTADYFREDEDLKLDLTNLDQPDDSWDVLIVYHILEHIPDDRAAMKEMLRVLRPGGRAFVQVPIEIGRKKNYEDPSITTDEGRSKAFGQKDHVRKYGSKGFMRRLKAAGFDVEPVDYLAMLDPELVEKHRMSASFTPPLDESIWVLTKPMTPKPAPTKRHKGRSASPEKGEAEAAPPTPAAPEGTPQSDGGNTDERKQ